MKAVQMKRAKPKDTEPATSPLKKSVSKKKKAASPNKKDVSQKKRTLSPKNKAGSPKKRTLSPTKKAASQKKKGTPCSTARYISPSIILILNFQSIPEQKNDKTSGYFIMRYMKEIVKDKNLDFSIKWAKRSNLVYTDNDIDEIRAEWAKHVLKFPEN